MAKKATKRKRPSAKRQKKRSKNITPVQKIRYPYRIYLRTPNGERVWIGHASKMGFERNSIGCIKPTGAGAYQRILNLVKVLPSNWGVVLVDRDIFTGVKRGEVNFNGRLPSEAYYIQTRYVDGSAIRRARNARDKANAKKTYETIRLS